MVTNFPDLKALAQTVNAQARISTAAASQCWKSPMPESWHPNFSPVCFYCFFLTLNEEEIGICMFRGMLTGCL